MNRICQEAGLLALLDVHVAGFEGRGDGSFVAVGKGPGQGVVFFGVAYEVLIEVATAPMTGRRLRTARCAAADRLSTAATHLPRGLVIECRAGDPVFSRQRRQPMQITKAIAYVAFAVSLIGGFMVGATQAAGDNADHIMVTPDAVKWVDTPPSVPAGEKWAVLAGDPPQTGPFIFRVKVPAGSSVIIPTDSPHYFVTKDETMLQVHGIGPWGITLVNPPDDPRHTTTIETRSGSVWFDMRIGRLIVCICLLSFLLSSGLMGCANSRQPTISLEQWDRARRAAGVGLGGD